MLQFVLTSQGISIFGAHSFAYILAQGASQAGAFTSSSGNDENDAFPTINGQEHELGKRRWHRGGQHNVQGL